MIKVISTQSCVQVVHQADVGGVVQRRAFGQQTIGTQEALCVFMALFGHEHLVRLFVYREVARRDDALACAWVFFTHLACQRRHDAVDGHIQLGVVFCLAADDEWRARLIDQDGIHLVHDGEVEFALHTVCGFVDHVVAEVVKAEFVVRAVGDVSAISRLLFITWHLWQVDTHSQAQPVVQARHPLRIATGQVVVHRHHVHALPGEGVEVHRQCGGQSFAFTRAHF